MIGEDENNGISGGQRKRVNIALELVSPPEILILDEPTSGLDSYASLELMKLLKVISRQIPTILVIHQPRVEIVQLFDKILLLRKGGEYLGYGSPEQCFVDLLPYTNNPVDIIFNPNNRPDLLPNPDANIILQVSKEMDEVRFF